MSPPLLLFAFVLFCFFSFTRMTFTTSRAGRVDSCLAFCRQWQLRCEQVRWCHVKEALIYSRPPVNNMTHIHSLELHRPRFLSCNVAAAAQWDDVKSTKIFWWCQKKRRDQLWKRNKWQYTAATGPRGRFLSSFSIFQCKQPPTGRRFHFLSYLKVNGDG